MSLSIKSMMKSFKHKYNLVPLKGCARHQEFVKIFVGADDVCSFVVKVPSMPVTSPEFQITAEHLQEEIKILRDVQGHLNIIQQLCIPDMDGHHITAACNCPISRVFTDEAFENISDEQRCHTLRGIAAGIAFIHERGYVHGDIHMGNILFSEIINLTTVNIGTPKIIDFGYALKVDRPVIESILDSSTYNVEHAYGLQAVDGLPIFLTDMLRFFVHVFLPVFGLSISIPDVRPTKMSVDGHVGLSLPKNILYDTAMLQLMLISDIENINGELRIDPFKVPLDITQFVSNIVQSRIIPEKRSYTGFIFKALKAVVRFPRGDVAESPDAAWACMIGAISNVPTTAVKRKSGSV